MSDTLKPFLEHDMDDLPNETHGRAGDGRDVPGYLHRCVPCRQKNAVNFLAGNTPGVMASYAPEMNSRQAERALQPTSPTVTPAIRDLAAESDETVERLVEWREQATY